MTRQHRTEQPNVHIRALEGLAELHDCVRLQKETWGSGFSEHVPATMLQLGQRLGGIALGAFDESGRMLGFVFGLPGIRHGEIVHWSDMLAVHPAHRSLGIGEALKRRQREVLLENGFHSACWTFDPLEARNAHVNFVHLGVTAREYVRDCYGDSDSPLHSIIGTDRIVVVWDLASDRVEQRLTGKISDRAGLETAPGNVIHVSKKGPRSSPPRLDLEDPHLRVVIPSDIQALKSAAPTIAVEWRTHTRAAFETYLGRGYVVIDFVRDEGSGSYVLSRA
ncbi:MAG: GNAT family N-acetyltransferase [Longimicrobiales bacterium]